MPDCEFDNPTLTCPRCRFVSPVAELRRNCPEAPPCNAGSELHELLASVGIKPEPGCPCNDHLAEMNRWGCDKCRREVATIVGWMREEFDRRRKILRDQAAEHVADPNKPAPDKMPVLLKMPFNELAAKLLVSKAIRRAERAAK